MDLGTGLGHLPWSTLVHPGDDWAQMWERQTTSVPKVKARIAPKRRFGVSARLSAKSAELLAGNRAGGTGCGRVSATTPWTSTP